jgi:drug/metabolite transporter (DMT)-like permease
MKTELKSNAEWTHWAVLVFLSIIWGTSFILIKKSLIAFSDFQVASLRIAISAIAFLPVILWQFKKINWKNWKKFLIVGLTGSGIPPFLFSAAQTKISSSLAGALNGLTTIFTLIFAILFFNQKWDKSKALGVVLGLLGAGFIILFNNKLEGNFFYASLIVVATILYGFNGNMIKWFFDDENPLHISAVSLGLLGPGALIILFSSDFVTVMRTHPDALYSLGAVTILSLLSTVMASVIFFRLIQKTNAVFASTVTYLIPFIAVIWGVFDGESFHYLYMVSLIVILGGVYLTRK